MRKILSIFIFAAIVSACSTNVREVKLKTYTCAAMPAPRASAASCEMDGMGYVFGGRDQDGTYLNDLWQYDPENNQWTDLGNAPMKSRVKATMIGREGKLYVGLGYSALKAYRDTAYQQDWWQYDIETQKWSPLADYPNRNTVAATPLVIGDTIYVLYGSGVGFGDEIGEYHCETNQWTVRKGENYRAKACFGACGAMLDGMLYFGTGYNTYNLRQWYAVDISKDQWTQLPSIPGKGRQWSACAASSDHIYLLGGRYFAGEMTGGEVFDTYMRYDPTHDQWEWCGAMPCGRAENQIAFTISGTPYFGLGEDDKGQIINQLYRIED